MVKNDAKLEQYIVVSHVYATGPAHQLVDYLKTRVSEVIFIGHPFSYTKDNRSFLYVYRQGKLVEEKKFKSWKGPELFFYLKDIFLTLWWLLPRAKDAIFIGVNNFNALTGGVLKYFGRVKILVFYTIDYIPQRFKNNWLNTFYHSMDRTAVKISNKIWNLSDIMVSEREKRGVSIKYRSKQITVPIGTIILSDSPTFLVSKTHRVVFMGHLREGQGVETLLHVMKEVIDYIPQAELLVIGGGPLEKSLRDISINLGIEAKVTFSGFVEKFSDMLQMLRTASLAVAPYLDNEATYTRYTDPGKPKDYLACGLPVVITKVPAVAEEIDRRRCGIAVDDNPHVIAEAIILILQNETLRQEYSRNALTMARDYTWENVFDQALARTLN